jgi:hypothetical protein
LRKIYQIDGEVGVANEPDGILELAHLKTNSSCSNLQIVNTNLQVANTKYVCKTYI